MTDRDLDPSSIPPPLPPTQEDEQFARLRLLRSRRVGVSTFNRLLAEHGTAQNALAALPEVARAAGVSGYEICPESAVIAELKSAHATGARLVSKGDAAYPALLGELNDAPPFLWAVGDISQLKRPKIALVGARNASSLGTRMAKRLAQELGEAGYIVVSGLARGVDTAAHWAALPTGTIAVLGGGVDVLYPAENSELAAQIGSTGLRLSEQPMGLRPIARHFPARNRIISGLCSATVVVEAAAKSGSLITARGAADQGRDVLAVPGHPMDARAAGCNMLIRDGATLVRSAEDIIEALGSISSDATQQELPLRPSEPRAKQASPNRLHQRILAHLGPSPIAEDQLIRDLAASASDVSPVLVDMEINGQIERRAGGLLARVANA